jgi:Tfp pilus assembly protein PilO
MNRNIVGFLLFVVAVGMGFGVLWPKIHEVRAITLERNAKHEIAKHKQKRRDDLRRLSGVLSGQQPRVTNLVSSLPKEPEIPEVLVTLETMAQSANVSITSLVPHVDKKKQEVTVTVVGDGDLPSVERIMQSIAENNRPMSITTTTLTRRQDGRVAFSLTVVLPYVADRSAKAEGVV